MPWNMMHFLLDLLVHKTQSLVSTTVPRDTPPAATNVFQMKRGCFFGDAINQKRTQERGNDRKRTATSTNKQN